MFPVGSSAMMSPGSFASCWRRTPSCERPCYCHALLLAAGKLSRLAARLVSKPYKVQHVRNALLDESGALIRDTQHERDVFVDVQLLYQAEILEHHADRAAELCDFVALCLAEVVAVDEHSALRGHYLARHELYQRGFTRSAASDDKYEFAVVYPEVDILKCVYSAGVMHVDIL